MTQRTLSAAWGAAPTAAIALALSGALAACSPTIKVEAPDEPIVINLNIRIEQEVLIRVDTAVTDLLQDEAGLFGL